MLFSNEKLTKSCGDYGKTIINIKTTTFSNYILHRACKFSPVLVTVMSATLITG